MNEQKKTVETKVFVGIWKWMLERYPPAIFVLHSLVYMTSISISTYIETPSTTPLSFSFVREIFGSIAFFTFPLMLRIMDEHKDYEKDCETNPQRVLQRGETSLKILARLGWMCVCVQLLFSVYADQGFSSVSLFWLLTLGYSILMGKEFFCGAWLEKRMVLYAISHQLITPISMLWICSVPISPSFSSIKIWGFLLTALLCTFSYEIARKIRAPEDEQEGVDSYTKTMGLRTAPIVTLCLFAAATGLPIYYFDQIGLEQGVSTGLLCMDAIVFLLCTSVCVLFLLHPKKKWAKSMEAASGILTLWIYGWILYAVCMARDIIWM